MPEYVPDWKMWHWSHTTSSAARIVPRRSPYGWVRARNVRSQPIVATAGSLTMRTSSHGRTTSKPMPGTASVCGSPAAGRSRYPKTPSPPTRPICSESTWAFAG